MAHETEDYEQWLREIIEALRHVDPDAHFNLALTDVDFTGARGYLRVEFPFDELREFVDSWLATLDPEKPEALTSWNGGGVSIGLKARGRSPDWRGWKAMPSLNLLEQQMGDLHLVGEGRRQLHTLTLEEVRDLASGARRVVGQGSSYQETFTSIREALEYRHLTEVGQLPPAEITVFAGMLGLVEAPPGVGNFEQGWRSMWEIPPDEF